MYNKNIMKEKKKFILDVEINQLPSLLKPIITDSYRIKQIIDWIYVKKSPSFDYFSNLPKDIREKLNEAFKLRSFTSIVKKESILDGTIRYSFKTFDNKHVYAVFMPTESTKSVCISTQIGCPISCTFCSSGKIKFVRNLSRGEILEEILYIANDTGENISSILFMGMGEPLLNYKNLISAIKTLLSKKEMNISKRHITVSTMGVIPAIKNLADQMYGIKLALSLHATNDKQRKKLIPNNFDNSIESLLETCKYYLKKTNSKLTIEYILIKGFNDTSSDAHRLTRLLKTSNLIRPSVQVNLIPYNQTDTGYQTPDQIAVLNFKKILKLNGIIVNTRQARGLDIGGACGQLS
ncbi:23S rRNA (adenine(2503)-C(2))-methyltransferase RlmN [Candidatus Ruminimicrobium bovinum]|uniref:23S rRNA (adenine(2503)-C(2))-methyltransferase RlmN n=1 Tax=Candidatus Ruminimicrobium bovinum TaxID=3242779 RepID=UPI0039B8ECE6